LFKKLISYSNYGILNEIRSLIDIKRKNPPAGTPADGRDRHCAAELIRDF